MSLKVLSRFDTDHGCPICGFYMATELDLAIEEKEEIDKEIGELTRQLESLRQRQQGCRRNIRRLRSEGDQVDRIRELEVANG